MSDFINSIGLTVSGVIIYIFLLFMIFLRKKSNTIDQRVFRYLLLGTGIISACDLVFDYLCCFHPELTTLNFIVQEIYGYMWFFQENLLLTLIIAIAIKYNPNLNKYLENKKLKNIYYSFVAFFPIIFLLLFDVYPMGGNGVRYSLTGPLIDVVYVYTTVITIVQFTILYKNRKYIKNINFIPNIVLFAIYLFISILTVIYDLDIEPGMLFFSAIDFIFYLTLENQELEELTQYEELKNDALIANKEKTDFLINMSHEIRTPMSTILGYSQLISNDKDITNDEFKSDVKNISIATNELLDLINNILDISKLESNKIEIKNENYLLENILFEVNSLVPSKIQNNNLNFSIDINENIPKEYFGDSKIIFKIISNILLDIISDINNCEINLNVNGDLIDANIFEFNFLITSNAKLENNLDKDENSLYLNVAKRLLNLINGSIIFDDVSSKYNIKIKQKIVNKEKISNIFSEENILRRNEIFDFNGKKVLIISKNNSNTRMFMQSLQKFKLDLFTCEDALNSKNAVIETKYDLIFVNYLYNDIEATKILELLNSSGLQLPPIIAFSDSPYEENAKKYNDLGFSDYIKLPVKLYKLNRILDMNIKKGGE